MYEASKKVNAPCICGGRVLDINESRKLKPQFVNGTCYSRLRLLGQDDLKCWANASVPSLAYSFIESRKSSSVIEYYFKVTFFLSEQFSKLARQ